MMEWREACKSTELDGGVLEKKKTTITNTVIDKVAWAINISNQKNAEALAYAPEAMQTKDYYQHSTRGRKTKLDPSADTVSYLENSRR